MAEFIQLAIPFANNKEDGREGRKIIWQVPMWGLTMYEPTKRAGKDPCAGCWTKDLCDRDECGRKSHPLFVDNV